MYRKMRFPPILLLFLALSFGYALEDDEMEDFEDMIEEFDEEVFNEALLASSRRWTYIQRPNIIAIMVDDLGNNNSMTPWSDYRYITLKN